MSSIHRVLKLLVSFPRVYVRLDKSASDQGVMYDLLLVIEVDSRLLVLLGASLVDLLGTRIFCSTVLTFLIKHGWIECKNEGLNAANHNTPCNVISAIKRHAFVQRSDVDIL